ncbi:MAG: serine/threonine protein kinase [Rhodobacteraceae bacterium]|nr:serine/threonine protein kinase [Paracoccaceae bacterium]MBO27953.1 serine/threonine protein kinase [Paracoccaceae bacterium]
MNRPAARLALCARMRGEAQQIRPTLARLLGGLSPLSLSAEDRDAVEIVLAEALNNIVEHAYCAARVACPIDIMCRHGERALDIRITDGGRPMPDDCPPPRTEPTPIPQENGFGWMLIHTLTDDVSYCRRRGKNHLAMRLPLRGQGAA